MTNKQFLYIIIATFITVMIWVTLDIIRDQSKVQAPPEVTELLEPLNPNFDQETLDKL